MEVRTRKWYEDSKIENQLYTITTERETIANTRKLSENIEMKNEQKTISANSEMISKNERRQISDKFLA